MSTAKTLYFGTNALKNSHEATEGEFITYEGEDFYVIKNVQHMDAFFMSLVSDSNHWMFISSNGALTAGRKNPENALFPYYTVDKIHDAAEHTGSKTIVKATTGDKTHVWEPFSSRYDGIYHISRNLYKNISGNKIIFEETNHDLLLAFTYQWCNSDTFGFIRKASVTNLGTNAVAVDLLDGIQNIMPQGVNRGMQTSMSSLVDAYKKCELHPNTGLGIFVLSSIPVDRAEPSESLKANTVWAVGSSIQNHLVSSLQLDAFRKGLPITTETDVRGKRGAYFVRIAQHLEPQQQHQWYMAAEVNQTYASIVRINNLLLSGTDVAQLIEADIRKGTLNLMRIVASADGLQLTNDKATRYRQFSNVMFNVMRGGIFDNAYTLSKSDLTAHAISTNNLIYEKHKSWFGALPNEVNVSSVLVLAQSAADPALTKLCMEYLPLTFSRRHGDPSRPWNLFSIETRNDDGSKNLNYQGNWRDIFQNWEALSLSYPGYIESMIAKFVNASTIDGYNPYRVTRQGFEWEIQDMHDPWSFIGYWGDHQVIYLCKLLEVSQKYHPEKLQHLLQHEVFAYANVPYRIKTYEQILENPYATIVYDEILEKAIAQRVAARGADGKLVFGKSNDIYFVNLAEKLLVTMLAKLGNFVPEGGIWMNTQRPEWNDANNALSGYGLSMVTLYYLHRYVRFCKELFAASENNNFSMSQEVATLLETINNVLQAGSINLNSGFSDQSRKNMLDALGKAASEHRQTIYKHGFSEKREAVSAAYLDTFFDIVLAYITQSIKANKRADKLYNAYNLLEISASGLGIRNLYEMLEGQVSVLSSGALSVSESLEVLEALRKSPMYRSDQSSYMLYPDRQLPRFMDKNIIPGKAVEQLAVFQKLIAMGDTSVIEKDINGQCHFNGSFTNKNVLASALEKLQHKGIEVSNADRESIFEIYESMFRHKAFTGRSGSFYSYEGLGCIYWHMNAKLLLTVSEIYTTANAADKQTIETLRDKYYEIRSGFGLNKTPAQYGAFPTDPYSHTPGHSGAQQPGMTGQVKEDIISRFSELGLVVKNGTISFCPSLLRQTEYTLADTFFSYFDIAGNEASVAVEKGSVAYTYCQVPIVVKQAGKDEITVHTNTGAIVIGGATLTPQLSKAVFERTGTIISINVCYQ